jgi:hypothetical protein
MIYPDVKDAENPTAHTSVRFEKLAEGVRDIAKFNWLLENYPAYEKTLARSLENIGGDLADTVTKAQGKVNDAGREAAVAELIKTAEASEHTASEALTAAVASAKAVMGKTSPTAEELREAAYAIAAALRDTAPEETVPDTEAPTDPADNPADEDPAASSDADTDTSAETDAPVRKGCGSALGMGVAATAAAAAVALKKKKEE